MLILLVYVSNSNGVNSNLGLAKLLHQLLLVSNSNGVNSNTRPMKVNLKVGHVSNSNGVNSNPTAISKTSVTRACFKLQRSKF